MPRTSSTPPPKPIYTLDLGGNGGRFAPTSLSEATEWIQRELAAWSWTYNISGGNHDQSIREALSQLNSAQSQVNQAEQYREANPQHYAQILLGIAATITDVFVHRKLPHTSSPIFKRLEAYRTEAGDLAATFFVCVHVPPSQGYHPQPQSLQSWRGLLDGFLDRYPPASIVSSKLRASEASFEELRSRVEAMIGEKTTTLDSLHRDYQTNADSIATTLASQVKDFSDAQTERSTGFETLLGEHKTELANLRRTFREEMSLRAPAEYWTSKRTTHLWIAGITGILSFASIAVCGAFLVGEINSLMAKSVSGSTPENWKIAILILISLFAVWAVRLVVRLFLSHTHLTTDAAERVVMLKTYLSLLEGDSLASADDRQLILQAIFRPASDGIVKDEAVPPSFMEYLTRSPRGSP
jgi:hypothetical protein